MEAAPGMLGTPLADLGVRTPALVRGEVRADVTVVTASAPVWWLTRDGIGGGTDFLLRLWLPFTLMMVASQVWSLSQSYSVGFLLSKSLFLQNHKIKVFVSCLDLCPWTSATSVACGVLVSLEFQKQCKR